MKNSQLIINPKISALIIYSQILDGRTNGKHWTNRKNESNMITGSQSVSLLIRNIGDGYLSFAIRLILWNLSLCVFSMGKNGKFRSLSSRNWLFKRKRYFIYCRSPIETFDMKGIFTLSIGSHKMGD